MRPSGRTAGQLTFCDKIISMSYNNYRKRSRDLFNPDSKEPFKLSRSRLENFVNCERCFYMDRRLGLDRPSSFPFNLNSAVDILLKKEFDIHRTANTAHPLMENYGIDAVPFEHEKMDEWRDPFTGVRFFHEPSGFLVFGGVDDIWVNPDGELLIVDYKATSKDSEVTLDAEWQDGYKRQMEIYQWLFRQNGFKVSNTGYFVYANGKRDREAFDGVLEFDVKVIPYEGNDSWIEGKLMEARKCLEGDLPKDNPDCEYCAYKKLSVEAVLEIQKQKKRDKDEK